jgi:dihydroorotase
LDRLEAFASFHGADFYGLPRNQSQIKLARSEWQMPAEFVFDDDVVVPIRADETIRWLLQQD